MNEARHQSIARDLQAAKQAIGFAEEALLKGLTATCSYELDTVAFLVKSARKSTNQAMREHVARQEKEATQ